MRTKQLSIYDDIYDDCTLRRGDPNGQECICCWSGGKDSTATAILLIIEGWTVNMVHAQVMFTEEIPLITKRHSEFIEHAAERFREYGSTVDFVRGLTYCENARSTLNGCKDPVNDGKMRGYPIPGFCNFLKEAKQKPIRDWMKNLRHMTEFRGICFDENHRKVQLTQSKRSILCDKEITQIGARMICEANDLLSPTYHGDKNRDGCALCPNANPERIREWLNDYPQALPILRDLDRELEEKAKFGNVWGREYTTLHDIGIL